VRKVLNHTTPNHYPIPLYRISDVHSFCRLCIVVADSHRARAATFGFDPPEQARRCGRGYHLVLLALVDSITYFAPHSRTTPQCGHTPSMHDTCNSHPLPRTGHATDRYTWRYFSTLILSRRRVTLLSTPPLHRAFLPTYLRPPTPTHRQ
jgi:hypothetical protein